MNPLFGIILHAIGGLAAGSFYIPYRRVKNWSWESYWLTQGFWSWIIAPVVVSYLTVPDLWSVLTGTAGSSLLWTYIFGAMWGIGGLTFGLTMRYLGMSLGYALALGLCAAFGTIVPPVFMGTAAELFTTISGLTVLAGVIVCLSGIAICCYAGLLKEKELTEEEKKKSIKEFSLTIGVIVAVFAGLMSACMAFAIQAGIPIAERAIEFGTADIYRNNPVFIIAMGGGFTTNFIWCVYLNIKNKSAVDYITQGALGNYLLAATGGVVWYCQFFFYGMGSTKMGRYDYASWTIHMAFVIVFSNMWGLIFKEWKGSSRKTMTFVLYKNQ